MKYFLITALICISITVSSQRLIRGYSVNAAYGFLETKDAIEIKDKSNGGETVYNAEIYKSRATSIIFGLPFEYGFSRHRFTLFPGADVTLADFVFKFENDNVPFGRSAGDSIKLASTIIMPQLGLHYRYHFFINKIHLAFGIGADAKLPVSVDVYLTDKTKLMYADHFNYDLSYDSNSVIARAQLKNLVISPKLGFDIYFNRFLVLNLYYYRTNLNAKLDKISLSGHFGGGVSYLLPFGKNDESRVLQQYKKQ